jgi:hypothetical protein
MLQAMRMNDFFFTHQSVRDLAWVIHSPALLAVPGIEAAHPFTQLAEDDGWLRELDQAPQLLEQGIAAIKRHTLGSYYEYLVAFALRHLPATRIHAVNLQVQEGKITVGEFDFIIQTDKWLHLEVAVKFYLQIENSDEWCHYVGARGYDCLHSKMEKLLHHQLRLSHHPAGRKLLEQRGFAGVTPQLLLQGYFFYPHAAFASGDYVPPHHATARHLRGWWCRSDAVAALEADEYLWAIPVKLQWLSPLYASGSGELLSFAALSEMLEAHFAASDRAVLVVSMQRDEAGNWSEQHRGFVLPAAWPAS